MHYCLAEYTCTLYMYIQLDTYYMYLSNGVSKSSRSLPPSCRRRCKLVIDDVIIVTVSIYRWRLRCRCRLEHRLT